MVLLNNRPATNFRDLDVYPTPEEILGDRQPFRKNIISGNFKDVHEYLDIQFRLLREDFVANIREAIENYRSKEPTKSVTIYQNMRIFKDRTRSNEPCLKIQINCENDDKKFMMGSLLIFTKNNFNNMFLAKVLNKNCDKGDVSIELINLHIDEINLNQFYTMAECSQYFDPYFNVLNGLRNISTENFPMEKYIVYADATSVYMPKYLIYSGYEYDIDGFKISPQLLPRITKNLLGLNSAQLSAFKAALTQEFVVIQGPPGTGKTHLGVKIASTLIQNFHFWYKNSPLLIISHKNDALDQFLEGLIPITHRLLRVGGQSKSEKLRPYNITNEKATFGFKRRPKEDYLRVMQKSLVVGMTTSIAARWKDFLEQLKCPIVIVEEAAEVLEAHVVAALTNNCQHLILMGDHQQLQPLSADYNVSKNFHLGISLFERMVMNNIQHYQLNIQHRMRPEISSLLKVKIYPFLEDHESVKNRPEILGMAKNVFFFDHEHPEETCSITTKKNSFEARFVVQLCKYLILNDYSSTDIAILATYTAQVQEIESLIKTDRLLEKIKVSTLDGFQGQEAEIVLLSLVRSEAIGFLGKENRVCVALSRARSGFYIAGNMKLLAKNSRLWASIRKCLENQKSFGGKFPLKCVNHGNMTYVKDLEDFWRVQNGGCSKKCQVSLNCGHSCSLLCHLNSMKHKCESGCLGSTAVNGNKIKKSDLWTSPSSSRQRQIQEVQDDDFNILHIVLNVVRSIWNFFVNVF